MAHFHLPDAGLYIVTAPTEKQKAQQQLNDAYARLQTDRHIHTHRQADRHTKPVSGVRYRLGKAINDGVS